MTLTPPSVEYGLLSPMLIVLGVAVLGVLVEAFLPRARPLPGAVDVGPRRSGRRAGRRRRASGSISDSSVGQTAVVGAVAVDKPALFLQGTLLLIGILGTLLIAERRIASEVDAEAERRQWSRRLHPAGVGRAGQRRREGRDESRYRADGDLPADHVRARRHDAVRRRRRSADDVRRARGVLAAAVPDVRTGPATSTAVAGGGAQVLPARRVLVGVLPVRHRAAVRLLRRPEPRAASANRSPPARATPSLALSASACCRSACCSKSVRCHSIRGSPTSIRARPPRSPRSWRPPPRSRRSGRCCASSTSRCPDFEDDWRPLMWGIAILTMVVGTVTAVSQSDVKRMLAYSSVAHAGFILTGVIALNDSGVVGDVVLPVRLRLQHSRRLRRRQRGAQRGRRGGDRHDPLGGARPAAIRWWAWCSRCSCSPSPASR